ncbi:MAG TPA: formate--tetrahydrofolate ligase [Anaeromyxobacteraceae bacterium]|nr:formate--tetrahydrofolate ligase [Anaeromyxobacteraceae bacterium]
MPTSLEIAQAASLRPIADVARDLGLLPEELEPYGRHAAKVAPAAASRLAGRPTGRLVLVTAITPTPAGEGKTTTAVGLTDALRRLGERAVLTVRQPSLGPVFGIKGGGNGGGRAQVVPMEVFNLHLTGDFHAVTAAHNLAAALVDNHLNHGNSLGLEPASITWPRVVDVNDRVLRDAVVGLGGRQNGPVRESEWIITAASEVMAVLSLADDLGDLRRRLGRIVFGRRRDGRPAVLEEVRAAGAMTVLLAEAVKPNLMQTLEGSPVLVHAGPFGNIAQGTSSVAADRLGLSLAGWVVTEAGFGADLGAEKFVNIKCRQSGLRPSAAVLVATVRALKLHGGVGRGEGGRVVEPALAAPDVEAVRRGCQNLQAQIENVRALGLPVAVAVNVHPTDTVPEIEAVREAALSAGARAAVRASHFAEGGAGALELARAVVDAARGDPPPLSLLYPDEMPLGQKMETVARRIYRADGVDLSREAAGQIAELEKVGFGRLPVCMAKTQYSFSHDPLLGPNPRGFRLPVRSVRLQAGAGFVTAVTGEMQLMPGLPAHPQAEAIDVDPDGRVVGLR